MNGLRAVLGWDNIDVMLCKMQGFEIVTLQELWVKHLRPTAYKYKSQKPRNWENISTILVLIFH